MQPARRLLRQPWPGAAVRGRVARARTPTRRVARLAQGSVDAERDRHDRLLRRAPDTAGPVRSARVPPCSPGAGPALPSLCSTASCSRRSRPAFVAMTRIVGDVLTYLVQWTWALGTVTWIAIAWSCVAAWRRTYARDTVRPRARTADRRVGLYVAGRGARRGRGGRQRCGGTGRYSAARGVRVDGEVGRRRVRRTPAPRRRGRSPRPRPRGRVLGEPRASPTCSNITASTYASDPSSSPRTDRIDSSATTRCAPSSSSPTRENLRTRAALPGYRAVARDGGVTVLVGPP